MTMTAGDSVTQDPAPRDVFDPDEAFPRNSPLMKSVRRLSPSPSPPLPILPPQVSPSLSSGRESSNCRGKVPPAFGEAVLVGYLGNHRPVATGQSPSTVDGSSPGEADLDPGPPENTSMPGTSPGQEDPPGQKTLQFLAEQSLQISKRRPDETTSPNRGVVPEQDVEREEHPTPTATRHSALPNDILTGPSAPPYSPSDSYSPCQPGIGLPHPNSDIQSPTTSIPPSGHGGLPPIQTESARSDTNSQGPLPSIRAQLSGLDLKHHSNSIPADEDVIRHAASFARSPQTSLPPISSLSNHVSPPISPNNSYRQDLPSPAHSIQIAAINPYYHAVNGVYHRASGDLMASHANTGNTDQIVTPPISVGERMSVDGINNSAQAGGYTCTFLGCNAPPFQTQYLLNSHANVHSSARPHYCSVAGCPRAEGGKGFKRKNEMIRHGLVHDSPGYVCPFCPQREHKYPRPDNLQRHVRVHHLDKDKDDPLLREVLSQRPDGPNRGRRRRGPA